MDVYWISFEASGQLWNVGDDCGVRLLTFLAMGVVDTCTSGTVSMSSACFRGYSTGAVRGWGRGVRM